jgi:hypothetical protein
MKERVSELERTAKLRTVGQKERNLSFFFSPTVPFWRLAGREWQRDRRARVLNEA